MPDTTAYRLVFDAVRDFRPGIAGHQALEALVLAAIKIDPFPFVRPARHDSFMRMLGRHPWEPTVMAECHTRRLHQQT